jgi:hypothetical protein
MPVIHDQIRTRVAPEAVVVPEEQPANAVPPAAAAAAPAEARRNARRDQPE